jgi:hypothetical protein
MGMFDDIKNKVMGMAGSHGDQAKGAVDKGADMADEKTGGEHTENIDKGSDAAKDTIDKAGSAD